MSLLMASRRPGREAGATLPKSFTACVTPTYEGSGVTTHPSVVDMGRPWNGFRWWLADTPFPNDDDDYENPSIWGSNDRINWTVPAGLVNPIDPMPPSGYNSDTELVYDPDEGRMVCLWRPYVGGGVMEAAVSTNGNSWHHQGELTRPTEGWGVSPAVWRTGPGEWHMWHFGGPALPVKYTASSPLGPWTWVGTCTLTGNDPGNRWHGDVIRWGSVWLGVFAHHTTRAVYPMSSADGMTWEVGATLPGTAYRPAILPSTVPDHIDLWAGGNGGKTIYRRHHVSLWPGMHA